MTPVWRCIGTAVWPWVLAGGKEDLHHRVTSYRKMSSNWVACFLTFLKFFVFFVCMHTHVYVVCIPGVHVHGSEINLTLHLVLWDEIYHWPGISPWYLAVSSQHWGHRCILQFPPFSFVLGIQIWVLIVWSMSTVPLSHFTRPKDQFLWVKYLKIFMSAHFSSGFMFCG